MIEMTLHELVKETDNKVRWDANVGEAVFELYIPKWRVPTPWPLKIRVQIDSDQSNIAEPKRFVGTSDKTIPIVAIVERYSKHTKTARYTPIGDKKEWEIGEPYIPYSLLPSSADRLKITVSWD